MIDVQQFAPDTRLRHCALALRDIVETLDGRKASFAVDDATITYSPEHGFHMAADGEITDISEWVESPRLVPA